MKAVFIQARETHKVGDVVDLKADAFETLAASGIVVTASEYAMIVKQKEDGTNAIKAAIGTPTPDRLLKVAQALRLGVSHEQVYASCKIDPWFLEQLQAIKTNCGLGTPVLSGAVHATAVHPVRRFLPATCFLLTGLPDFPSHLHFLLSALPASLLGPYPSPISRTLHEQNEGKELKSKVLKTNFLEPSWPRGQVSAGQF